MTKIEKITKMTVQEIKEAIRLAESVGDFTTAEILKKRLQKQSVNS